MDEWIELCIEDSFQKELKVRTLMKKDRIHHIQEIKFDGMIEPQCEVMYTDGQYMQTARVYIDFEVLKNKLHLN
jgi:hypothetical protein